MICLEQKDPLAVQGILEKYPYTFYAFGSRVTDLDLCFIEAMPPNIISHIEEDFEESNLPYNNWNACNQEFPKAIQKNLFLLQLGQHKNSL